MIYRENIKKVDGTMDASELKNAFGSFATGVTVVATREADQTPRGFTANSFSSVSLEPPLLLICIAKSALSLAVFKQATFFSVNILCETQEEVSRIFASQSEEKFDFVPWELGFKDVPVLFGSLARFVCKTDRHIEAGDHTILIGEVKDFDYRQGSPLSYFRGQYVSIKNRLKSAGKLAQTDKKHVIVSDT